MESGRKRKIMVALEDNEKDMYALDWALNYLIPPAEDSARPDHFVILHVLPPALSSSPLVTQEEDMFQKQALRTMQKSCRYIENVHDPCKKHNLTYEVKVMVGEPKIVICEAAKKLVVDLLVVGNHEYGGLKWIFSSWRTTRDYCVQHAKCPVVVVKRRQRLTEEINSTTLSSSVVSLAPEKCLLHS